MSYNDHINSVVSNANQRTGMLFNGFLCRNMWTLRQAFISYVRPLVEYSSVVWSPILKKHIDSIETIQRKFTKRIPSIKHLSYLERLKIIELEPLELRRLHFDLIYYYKILHDLTPHNKDDFLLITIPPHQHVLLLH